VGFARTASINAEPSVFVALARRVVALRENLALR
jgi:hypothetical protein